MSLDTYSSSLLQVFLQCKYSQLKSQNGIRTLVLLCLPLVQGVHYSLLCPSARRSTQLVLNKRLLDLSGPQPLLINRKP